MGLPYFQGIHDETIRLAFAREEARILREEMQAAARVAPRWLLAAVLCTALLLVCLAAARPLGSAAFSLLDFVLLPVAAYTALIQFVQARRRLRDLTRQSEEHKDFLRRHGRDPEEFYGA